jgi:methionine-rich copper-binding protein CopC
VSGVDREEVRGDGAARGVARYTAIMRAGVAIVALVVALAQSAVVSAHARLERSVPASGAVLDGAPARVVLTFNSEVERRFSRFTLRLADGSERKLEGPAGAGLTRQLAIELGPLGPGEARLEWSVVSRDGHRIAGTLGFTVKGR